jgi:hypothetical protein
MRTVYHEQLSDLDRQLAEMCALAVAVMKQATEVSLEADTPSAVWARAHGWRSPAATCRGRRSGVRCARQAPAKCGIRERPRCLPCPSHSDVAQAGRRPARDYRGRS